MSLPTGEFAIHADASDRPASASIVIDGMTVRCLGTWTATGLSELAQRPPRLPAGGARRFDLDGVSAMDTAGALLLGRLGARSGDLTGGRPEWGELLRLVAEAPVSTEPVRRRDGDLARLGRITLEHIDNVRSLLAFVGEAAADLLPRLLRPRRLRWRALIGEIERAGVNALPITGLLSFLMGVVMAYQGGTVLSYYGANIFLVDLIGITMLREMAPLLVAIVVAGRTGSAYAAELGTMRLTEELDALRTMGITPFEMLVLPKLFGLLLAMPLLTLWADALGVLGGAVIANALYGVSLGTFWDLLPQVVPTAMFWAGIAKAPVFAALIAVVGCYQGFRVRGSAAEVGRATTISVVQSIFLVIITDALFSIAYQQLGI
jgi:phospholipid/cholesterol/gamma-HCH transport system permease protein